MKKEIEVASWWWTTQLRLNDLSQEQVLLFQNCLTDLLLQKYQNHWYEDNPLRGHAYRSILYEGNKLDSVLLQAAEKAAIKNLNDRLQATPMIMWIDPGEIEVKYFITNARYALEALSAQLTEQ